MITRNPNPTKSSREHVYSPLLNFSFFTLLQVPSFTFRSTGWCERAQPQNFPRKISRVYTTVYTTINTTRILNIFSYISNVFLRLTPCVNSHVCAGNNLALSYERAEQFSKALEAIPAHTHPPFVPHAHGCIVYRIV
jgi:hypothetical protein